jgi:hypothetical protein
LIKGATAILLRDREGFATAPSTKHSTGAFAIVTRTGGLRDLEAVAALAQSVGFSAPVVTEMPANNLSCVPSDLIETVRWFSDTLDRTETSRTIVGVGLFNLGLGVHDKGTARNDRLMQWTTGIE